MAIGFRAAPDRRPADRYNRPVSHSRQRAHTRAQGRSSRSPAKAIRENLLDRALRPEARFQRSQDIFRADIFRQFEIDTTAVRVNAQLAIPLGQFEIHVAILGHGEGNTANPHAVLSDLNAGG